VARFEQATDEFDCRWDEAQFGVRYTKLRALTGRRAMRTTGGVLCRCGAMSATSKLNSFRKATITLNFCRTQLQPAVTFRHCAGPDEVCKHLTGTNRGKLINVANNQKSGMCWHRLE
jgi:hypothetical protein